MTQACRNRLCLGDCTLWVWCRTEIKIKAFFANLLPCVNYWYAHVWQYLALFITGIAIVINYNLKKYDQSSSNWFLLLLNNLNAKNRTIEWHISLCSLAKKLIRRLVRTGAFGPGGGIYTSSSDSLSTARRYKKIPHRLWSFCGPKLFSWIFPSKEKYFALNSHSILVIHEGLKR